MIQENEVVMLTLGLGINFFIIVYRKYLKCLPGFRIFLFSFRVLLAAWFFTVIEGFFWNGLFNALEHVCYTCSSAMLALWFYKITRTNDGGRR